MFEHITEQRGWQCPCYSIAKVSYRIPQLQQVLSVSHVFSMKNQSGFPGMYKTMSSLLTNENAFHQIPNALVKCSRKETMIYIIQLLHTN